MEVEKAKEIRSSQNWAEVCKELDLRINNLMQQLKICAKDQLEKIQDKIKAYEEVKRLPTDVIEREE